MDEQGVIQNIGVAKVADDQPIGWNGGAMAVDETVIDPHIVSTRLQHANRVAADVARSAGDEDAHVRESERTNGTYRTSRTNETTTHHSHSGVIKGKAVASVATWAISFACF